MRNGKHAEDIVARRADEIDAEDDEPILTDTRSIHYSGNSLVVSIPAPAAPMLGVDAGDSMIVEIYREGIFLRADTDETEE